MPGIVGIIEQGWNDKQASLLDEMIKCMKHDVGYTSGTYIDRRLGLSVGWVNLDRSFSDCMPVWNETNDICLIFSGEDFTDFSDINSLKKQGHQG